LTIVTIAQFTDRFRDPDAARAVAEAIRAHSTRPVRLMEFCGGHTHAILRFGIPDILPPTVQLRSGPGCPVCVTASVDLDWAIALAQVPEVILTTFGDMIRVPGSRTSLAQAKAEGADVRVVYSPLDALRIAREVACQNPAHPVIFLGVGFETTAPMVGSAVLAAEVEGLENFFVFSTHKLTPPATRAILNAGEVALDGIIGPGHVTTVIGSDGWRFLPDEYGIPCAVAGFEPLDILRAILALVESRFSRSPTPSGAAWAQCPPAAYGCGRRMPVSTPPAPSRWKYRPPASLPDAAVGTFCEVCCSLPSALCLERFVCLSRLLAPAWSAWRERVQRTIAMQRGMRYS
jgi:hydrogenase expression/formation protein HypD